MAGAAGGQHVVNDGNVTGRQRLGKSECPVEIRLPGQAIKALLAGGMSRSPQSGKDRQSEPSANLPGQKQTLVKSAIAETPVMQGHRDEDPGPDWQGRF